MPIQIQGVDCNQVLLATHLQLSNGHRLLLVCLHLKAKHNYSDMREQQGLFVLDFLKSQSTQCDSIIVSLQIYFKLLT